MLVEAGDAHVPAPPLSHAIMSNFMGMPRGTAAWVLRNSSYFPVVTGGYRQAPLPDKMGMVRVRYLSVKDQHRTIEDFPPASLRSWDDANARAAAARQQPSANFSTALIAIVQRIADGEDADTVLRSTRECATGIPTSAPAMTSGVEAPAESFAMDLPAATAAPVPAATASSTALKRPRVEADSENAHPNPARPNPAEATGSGDAVPATTLTPIQSSPAAAVCSEVQSVPRCNHRHPLVRSRLAEPLDCDGACQKQIPRGDALWSCGVCDFDLCERCMIGRSGPAVYIGLLSAEEERSRAALAARAKAEERARQAEGRLAQAKRLDGKAAAASAAEARATAAAEARVAAEAEAARLGKEVGEVKERSKVNLEKMFAAKKEAGEAKKEAAAAAEAMAAALEERDGVLAQLTVLSDVRSSPAPRTRTRRTRRTGRPLPSPTHTPRPTPCLHVHRRRRRRGGSRAHGARRRTRRAGSSRARRVRATLCCRSPSPGSRSSRCTVHALTPHPLLPPPSIDPPPSFAPRAPPPSAVQPALSACPPCATRLDAPPPLPPTATAAVHRPPPVPTSCASRRAVRASPMRRRPSGRTASPAQSAWPARAPWHLRHAATSLAAGNARPRWGPARCAKWA